MFYRVGLNIIDKLNIVFNYLISYNSKKLMQHCTFVKTKKRLWIIFDCCRIPLKYPNYTNSF